MSTGAAAGLAGLRNSGDNHPRIISNPTLKIYYHQRIKYFACFLWEFANQFFDQSAVILQIILGDI